MFSQIFSMISMDRSCERLYGITLPMRFALSIHRAEIHQHKFQHEQIETKSTFHQESSSDLPSVTSAVSPHRKSSVLVEFSVLRSSYKTSSITTIQTPQRMLFTEWLDLPLICSNFRRRTSVESCTKLS